ncbi:MAG: hypothetical protein EB833_04665, partial [Thaumarchaeota archaeon S13]
MATTRKSRSSRATKKDLEDRIQKLEAQIEKLTKQQARPAEAPPKKTLPKGTAAPPPPPPQASSTRG